MNSQSTPIISYSDKSILNVPVLMYHSISDDGENDHGIKRSPFFISAYQFQTQMNYLHENNYQTLSLVKLLDLLQTNKTQDNRKFNKLIVITFDDGYKNNYFHAFKVLKKYKLTATFFVVVNRIATANYLSWEELKKMANEGMEIQSHTLNHKPLETLTLSEIERELRLSKEILEQRIAKSITVVSYPHGSYNEKIIEIAKKVGYQGSCTSEINFFNTSCNPFKISRIDVRSNYNLEDFKKIVQQDRLFIKKLKFSKAFKKKIQNTIGITNYNKLYKKVRRINRIED